MVFCNNCGSFLRGERCKCGTYATKDQLEKLTKLLTKKVNSKTEVDPVVKKKSTKDKIDEEEDHITVPEQSILKSITLTEEEKEINNYTRYFLSRWDELYSSYKDKGVDGFEDMVSAIRDFLKNGKSIADLANMSTKEIYNALSAWYRVAHRIKGISISFLKKYHDGDGLKNKDKEMTLKEANEYAEYLFQKVNHVFHCDKKPVAKYLSEGHNILDILSMDLQRIQKLVRIGHSTAKEVHEKTLDYLMYGNQKDIKKEEDINVPKDRILQSKKKLDKKPRRLIKRTTR